MIGHFLGTLTVEQEDRVLLSQFEPIYSDVRVEQGLPERWYGKTACVGCLLMAAGAVQSWADHHPLHVEAVGYQYEWACKRFGFQRINAAIRQRILDNRARRVLQSAPEVERVGSPRTEPQ